MPIDLDGLLHKRVISAWGEPVLYMPLMDPYAPSVQITAIFERHHQIVMDEVAQSELQAPGHATTAPVLTVRLADLPRGPLQNDHVIVGEETFTVWDMQPDGKGMADLVLRETS